MTDWVEDAQEVLWRASQAFGVRIESDDQVAVARELTHVEPYALQEDDVLAAYRKVGIGEPQGPLVREIVKRARGVRARPGLRDVLLDFRRDAIRNLSRTYGGKHKDEGALRDHILMYLPTRGYAESHTSRGQTDILLPPPDDAIIETKIWTALQKFEDGMIELAEYIRTEGTKQAYMVVFCDRVPLPPILDDHRQEIAEERVLEGLLVPVIVVPFDVDPPSKVAERDRRRRKSSGR